MDRWCLESRCVLFPRETFKVWQCLGPCLLGSLVFAASARAAELGTEPPHLVVRGVEHFNPRQMARQLEMPLWLQRIYGPGHGWRDPRVTLTHAVTAAYRKAGFRDVAVRILPETEEGTIELEVNEGRQYVAGVVSVEGAKQIDPADLTRRLAEVKEPASSTIETFVLRGDAILPKWKPAKEEDKDDFAPPLWLSGQPIVFATSEDACLDEVFADLGFPQARASVEVTEADEGTMGLVVRIEEEGPVQTAASIEIEGLKRNTRDDVLDYLGIRPGDPVNRAVRIDLTRRLWLSARFASVNVVLENSPFASGPILRIAVDEYEKAPLLKDKLSEAEEVMMRLHRWLAGLAQSDLVLKVRTNKGAEGPVFYYAPGQALALQLEGVRLFSTPECFEYYSDFQKKKLQTRVWSDRLETSLGFKLNKDRKDKDSLFQFTYYGMFHSDPELPSSPRGNLSFHVSPAACLALLNGRATEHKIEEGVLTIRSPKETLRIEAATGKLLEMQMLEDGKKTVALVEPVEMHLDDFSTVEWPEVASYEDALIPTRPVSSIAGLLARDWHALEGKPESLPFLDKYPPELAELFLTAADGALLKTIDDFVVQNLWETAGEPSRPRFTIADLSLYLAHRPSKGKLAALPFLAKEYGENLFPKNSWPANMMMAILSSRAGEKRMKAYYDNRVFMAPGAGPLRDVAVAGNVLKDEPALAQLFTAHGLLLLDLDGFHRDRDLFLDESTWGGRFLVNLTEVLRDADPEALVALQTLLLDKPDPGVTAVLTHLQYYRDQPIWQVLPEALDQAWEDHWKEQVEASLKGVAQAAQRQKK